MVRTTTILILFLLIQVVFVSQAEADFFNSDGVNIHYTDSKGSGSAVVLLHGFTMDSGMWYATDIAQQFEQEYRVIAIDLRGHGKSDKPESASDYGPKIGLDVINLLDNLNIEKAHMIGFSMGAFVVGRLLVTHPDRIHSAALGSGSFPTANNKETEFRESVISDMESHGDITLAKIAKGWEYDSVTEDQISAITVPIQAVYGSLEDSALTSLHKKLLEMPENSRPIVIIDGADHDSEKAAVLHPRFIEAAKRLIQSVGE